MSATPSQLSYHTVRGAFEGDQYFTLRRLFSLAFCRKEPEVAGATSVRCGNRAVQYFS